MEWRGDTSVCLHTGVMEDQRDFAKLGLGRVGSGDCGLCKDLGAGEGKKGEESPEFRVKLIWVTVCDRLGTCVGSPRPLPVLSRSPSISWGPAREADGHSMVPGLPHHRADQRWLEWVGGSSGGRRNPQSNSLLHLGSTIKGNYSAVL